MSKSMPVLKKFYQEEVIPELKKKFSIENIHDVPKLVKIVINTGVGAKNEKQYLEDVQRDMGLIAGQKAVATKARVSVSNFKLREGMPVGVRVTLRGASMWEFLYRLINISLPNIRDFRGVPGKLDGNGNYNMGITDHTVFPEISVDSKHISMGMDVTIVTTGDTDEKGRELLRLLGMPFRKPQGGPSQDQGEQPGNQAA